MDRLDRARPCNKMTFPMDVFSIGDGVWVIELESFFARIDFVSSLTIMGFFCTAVCANIDNLVALNRSHFTYLRT